MFVWLLIIISSLRRRSD